MESSQKIGVIFDLDGTVSDTQDMHSRLESEEYANQGIIISPQELKTRFSGMSLHESTKIVSQEAGVILDLEKFLISKRRRIVQAVSKNVKPMPKAIKLIKELANNREFSLALYTASVGLYAAIVLTKLKIFHFFQAIISQELVFKGKPNPEGFLLAAEFMKIQPERCVVIEDGVAGMQAGKSANMKIIGITPFGIHNDFTDLAVRTLREVTTEAIKSLFE